MHGGVAGVGRQLPPLCRSNGVVFTDFQWRDFPLDGRKVAFSSTRTRADLKTDADFTDESPTVDQFLRDSSEMSSAIEERF
jgi:hypothetical protein